MGQRFEKAPPHTGSRFGSTRPTPDNRQVIDQLLVHIENHRNKKRALASIIGLDTQNHPFPPIPTEVYQVTRNVETDAKEKQIWSKTDDQGRAFISMGYYLHPWFNTEEELSPAEQDEHLAQYLENLELINRLYAWLFYLDDTFGNDVQQSLSPEGQEVVSQSMKIVFGYLQGRLDSLKFHHEFFTLIKSLPPHLLPYAYQISKSFDVFQELNSELQAAVAQDSQRDTVSPKLASIWLETMEENLKGHLLQGLANQDKQPIVTVGEYIDRRREVSGMRPAVDAIRFMTKTYPDYANPIYETIHVDFDDTAFSKCEKLKDKIELSAFQGIGNKLCPDISPGIPLKLAVDLLQTCCIDYGGLVNDMVSLYKELKENSVFNLVAIAYLHTHATDIHFSLPILLDQIGTLMCLVLEYAVTLLRYIETAIYAALKNPTLLSEDKELLKRERYFCFGLYYSMLATYYWQVSQEAKPRYQESGEKLYTEFDR